MKEERQRRILGLMQGLALGDTFGMATEMMSYEKIKESIGMVKVPLKSQRESIILKNQPAFRVTDDTYNALMIYHMLVENKGKVDVKAYIDKLKSWAKSHPQGDEVIGPSTRRALELIEKGVPITETGKMGTTNGASMKIAPLGIFYDYKNLEELVDAVYQICLPTHNTTIAISGAALIATLASYILEGKDDFQEMKSLMKKTLSIAKNYGFNMPCASLEYRIDKALLIAESAHDRETLLYRLYHEIGSGIETIESVPSALALFFYTKGDPLSCAQLGASLGGDTDTIGAISCALAGGMKGEKIPKEYILQIEKVNGIDLHNLPFVEKMLPITTS